MSAEFWCPEGGGCARCAFVMVCPQKIAVKCPTCGRVVVLPNQEAADKVESRGCRRCRLRQHWLKMTPDGRAAVMEFFRDAEDVEALQVISEIDERYPFVAITD